MADGFWMRRALRTIGAASEALFPKNDLGAPDFESTRLVPRTREYLLLLPPEQRRLLIALFVMVEHVLRPFYSRASIEARADAVRRWRRSRLYPLRLIGDAVKGVLTMMYTSHPDVLTHIGMYSACEHPEQALSVPVRREALVQLAKPVKVAS